MSLPSPPDADWRRALRARLFGLDEVPGLVVSPMASVFAGLCAAGGGPAEPLSGWLPAALLEGGLVVARSPAATGVVDLVAALEPGAAVHFVGFAGSLGDAAIGDVVRVARSRDGAGRWHDAAMPTGANGADAEPSVANAQATSLTDAFLRHDELAAVADTVDMECAPLLAAARLCGVRAVPYLVITDRNASWPVTRTRRPDFAKGIGEACARAVLSAERSNAGAIDLV
jgi:hypothetical protein